MEDDLICWQLEDELKFFKWKTTSFSLANGRNFNFIGKWRTTSFYIVNGKQSQVLQIEENLKFLGQWKTILFV